MNWMKFLITTLVVFVAFFILDIVFHGQFLGNMYYKNLSTLFYQTGDSPYGMFYFIIFDVFAAAVFVWIYDKVYSIFGGSIQKGLTWGLYAGILVNFPGALISVLIYRGFPYSLSWWWVIGGIVYGIVAGIICGALYKKGAATA